MAPICPLAAGTLEVQVAGWVAMGPGSVQCAGGHAGGGALGEWGGPSAVVLQGKSPGQEAPW